MSIEAEDFLSRQIATSKEIQKNCDLTARQVATRIKKLGERIIVIPNGRSPKYALTQNAFGMGDSIHIWEVDNFGKHVAIGTLRPLATGGFFVQALVGLPRVFLGEAGNGLYDDLPYFLRDMAPQGFLGKKVAENLAKQNNQFPSHLSDWKNEHIGRYLLANTETSMGNLKFGNNVDLNIRSSFPKHRRSDYLAIADDIISNDTILSSAGGEQQKFTTYCTDINAHVLVKFSPKGDSENAKRWKDILITEYHASKVINQSKMVNAAETELIEDGGRLFLESKRFDRSGEFGRRSMLSLLMIDAEFVGSGDNWLRSTKALNQQGLLTDQDAYNVAFLSDFAKLAYNTDTHLGNISFETHHNGFALLPIYDMGSMAFAPKSNGEVTAFALREVVLQESRYKDFALQGAKYFWDAVLQDPRTSNELKQFITSELLVSEPFKTL